MEDLRWMAGIRGWILVCFLGPYLDRGCFTCFIWTMDINHTGDAFNTTSRNGQMECSFLIPEISDFLLLPKPHFLVLVSQVLRYT